MKYSMRAKPAVGHSRLRLAINLSRTASSPSAFKFNRPALPKHKKQKRRLFKYGGEGAVVLLLIVGQSQSG